MVATLGFFHSHPLTAPVVRRCKEEPWLGGIFVHFFYGYLFFFFLTLWLGFASDAAWMAWLCRAWWRGFLHRLGNMTVISFVVREYFFPLSALERWWRWLPNHQRVSHLWQEAKRYDSTHSTLVANWRSNSKYLKVELLPFVNNVRLFFVPTPRNKGPGENRWWR